jgi:cytidylate kinase
VNEQTRHRSLPSVVTIAALYGAGGEAVAPLVAERLGVRFLDRAVSNSVAKRAGLPVAVAQVEDAPRSEWQRLLVSLSRASPPTAASEQVEQLDLEEHRLRAEIEAFMSEATNSGGVVLGRGGAVVLGAVPHALHVYLGGSRKARITRVMGSEAIDRDAATQRVRAHDRARRDYVKSTYGIDGDNPALYHLSIDAVAIGLDTCVDLIVAAAEVRSRHVETGRKE